MSLIPVVEHLRVQPTAVEEQAVERLAEQVRRERPELAEDEQFDQFVVERLSGGPILHLDDVSDIPFLDGGREVRFMQDRARLRAGDGDLVASCSPQVEGVEDYCRDFLGLGAPHWLRPPPLENPLRIANACWKDRGVRRTLIRKLRAGEIEFLHPHMGIFAVWELAALLHQSSRCSLRVIAPRPALTRWANDKVAFAEAVTRLFGESYIPRTASAWNLGRLAQSVRQLAVESKVIGLKLPDSAGGDANLVIDAARFRGRSLASIRDELCGLLPSIHWDGKSQLLIDRWETDVVCAPSAQLWIPPETAGPPVVEGLFTQTIEGRQGFFIGTAPARFPAELTRELATRCWLLGRLFQRLGYVGRCSFDLILVGRDLSDCRLEFVECNGRWGGASLPMTLMNRLFGDWAAQPFAVQVINVPGLDRLPFDSLLESLRDELYDVRTGNGRLVFYGAGRMQFQSGITALALADTWEQASQTVQQHVPALLKQVVAERVGREVNGLESGRQIHDEF